MITSKAPRIEFDGNAVDVVTDEYMLRVTLADGREIAAPLEFFPRLRDATPEQRKKWELLGGGYGIHWEELDEDISVPGLLRRN
jgi:hypothetical protein